ncbi:hypothetical protein RFI_10277 [Reticulomyxa filosa]|uniref:MI domain-containing protein n=1 Tax=Reticulomyxa filosa TaxID=46433 RepID=X6NN87_RETFI|nr:hypothetical protein RFI_10277 [Reticulomyxa filosa]|eukprot:ETO26857.1 hypothetical protein RFI_10277 [Reticulomyxa filosa]
MGTRFYSFEVVKQIISTSMDRDNRCRELASKFLSVAIGDGPEDAIDRQSAELGFTVLLQRVEDLFKDVPDVLHYLSCFVARCIADEVLAPSFLESVHLLETDMGYAIIFRAQNLLKGRHANKRLQNVIYLFFFFFERMECCIDTSFSNLYVLIKIWGVSSEKPVKELKTAISAIVREFLVNEDMNETIDNIRDLNVPLFSHEIVKQCISAVTDYTPVNLDAPVSDSVRSKKAELVAELLSTCVKNNIIPSEELDRGFQRVRERINDLKLDSPQIAKYYNEIASKFKDVPLC